ncbi:ATP-binding protein [Mesorhizobium sp. M0306]|uniref:ATP-binding protein n=1 Tax=unclassified Mesorhizobium TaxID=325217 RepID=UPI0033364377
MSFPVIPQNLSISAMRSSGYRDTAHALAELIDNSIQSGQSVGTITDVELICIDEVPAGGSRRRLSRLAVFDNAAGMDPKTLRGALQFGNGTRLQVKDQKGIGKFGMGLPNSSISQCRRVDVWSWQEGSVYHSYLDVGEVERGQMTEVPEPQVSAIPKEWLKLVAAEIGPHGTLVVWSDLDRVSWKQSRALLRNTEFIAGRVYRHFIHKRSVRIRLASYEAGDGIYAPGYQSFVRPNDPLFLMSGTNAPSPYDQIPAFDPFGEPVELTVGYNGGESIVKIRASVCKPEARRGGGAKPIGQHARKNIGISVVRADRELELNRSFENSYDPRERWWGVEVVFDPALDDVFGVTNNKQSATGFIRRDLEEDAQAEAMSEADFQASLEEDRDPRLPMYRISKEIDRLLNAMRAKVAKMREGERVAKSEETDETRAEKAATASVKRRRERLGDTGQSDRDEKAPDTERMDAISSDIANDGVDAKKAREIAVDYVTKSSKFRFKHADISGSSMFDVSLVGGLITVTLNTRHPAHAALFEELREENATPNPYARQVLALIAAWARMEDESPSTKASAAMEEMRENWGRVARDFYASDEE